MMRSHNQQDSEHWSLTAYPLSWPADWKRATIRKRADFGKVSTEGGAYASKKRLSIFDATERILYELQRMGVGRDDVLISSNLKLRLDGLPRSDQGEPADPGVAVYWKPEGAWAKPMRCMAIDRYDRVADNLAAIAATIEAMRAIERHGGATILDRAFLGFAALPETASKPWREVLGITVASPTLLHIEERFRDLAKMHHPDRGGDRMKFEEIVRARDAARMEVSS